MTDSGTNQYRKFNSVKLTMLTSSLYLAALVAFIVASTVTRKWGRKRSMLVGGLLFLVGAVVNAATQNVVMLIIGCILLGFGIGFISQVCNMKCLQNQSSVFMSEINFENYFEELGIMFDIRMQNCY